MPRKSYNGFSAEHRGKTASLYIRMLQEGKAERLKIPQRCMACQTRHGLQRHSEDYSTPVGPHIGAFLFCCTCHQSLHVGDRLIPGRDQYRRLLREGYRFPAPRVFSYPAMMSFFTRLAKEGDGMRPGLFPTGTPMEKTMLDWCIEGEFDPTRNPQNARIADPLSYLKKSYGWEVPA